MPALLAAAVLLDSSHAQAIQEGIKEFNGRKPSGCFDELLGKTTRIYL
jgi:hypothetical protein